MGFNPEAFDPDAFDPDAFESGTLVTVPDVVGETQLNGTNTLEAALFVVSVQNAYSSTVAQGLIISQDPEGGSDAPEGSVVFIVVSLGDEPVSENKGAGRPKKKRRRLIVEIDGQDFEVSSEDDALALLEQARQLAVVEVEKARAAPVRVNHGIQRPRIVAKTPELKPVIAKAKREIANLYDDAIRDLEIRALIAKADEDEEEALLRFLI
jgi:hypothetical protein